MKTIEEAAKDFSKDIRENSLSGNNIGKEQYKSGRKIGFKAGVKFAQRWIPVEEELPEKSMETMKDGNYTITAEPVLIKTSNGRHAIAKRKMFLDHGWNWSGSGTFNDIVTHWRPIELK